MHPSDPHNLDQLATALAKAQAAMRPAIKDAENPHFRSRYADLTAVWDAVREPLTRNGLSVVQLPYRTPDGLIGVTTMLLHTSGQSVATCFAVRPVKDDAQAAGSALSYVRRYSLAAITGCSQAARPLGGWCGESRGGGTASPASPSQPVARRPVASQSPAPPGARLSSPPPPTMSGEDCG